MSGSTWVQKNTLSPAISGTLFVIPDGLNMGMISESGGADTHLSMYDETSDTWGAPTIIPVGTGLGGWVTGSISPIVAGQMLVTQATSQFGPYSINLETNAISTPEYLFDHFTGPFSTGVTSSNSATFWVSGLPDYMMCLAVQNSNSPYGIAFMFFDIVTGAPVGIIFAPTDVPGATATYGAYDSLFNYGGFLDVLLQTYDYTVTGLYADGRSIFPSDIFLGAPTQSIVLTAATEVVATIEIPVVTISNLFPDTLDTFQNSIISAVATSELGGLIGPDSYALISFNSDETNLTVAFQEFNYYAETLGASGGPIDLPWAYSNLAGENAFNGTAYVIGQDGTFYALSSATPPAPPPVPDSLVLSTATATTLLFSWNSTTGATSYILQYRITGTTAWTQLVGLALTEQELTGLVPNTFYDAQVASSNGTLVSAFSPTVTSQTLIAPAVAVEPGPFWPTGTNLVVNEIPLISSPQSLSISLSGVPYNLVVTWNNPAQTWMLDINDQNNNPIVNGIALITGADLLAKYASAGIGGYLVVRSDGDPAAMPTFTNLGSIAHLYYITEPT